jgi:hypothetical protein
MPGPAAVEIVLSARERGELEARVPRREIARAEANSYSLNLNCPSS